MKSIGRRLAISFVTITAVSILLLELLLLSFVRGYFYSNIQTVLSAQVRQSAQLYTRYFSNVPLRETLVDNVDVFWKQTSAQVQILDLQGQVLLDSIGATTGETPGKSDIARALSGESGIWRGSVTYDSAPVLAVSEPLLSEGKVVGVLRFVTTLRDVDATIMQIMRIFLIIGGLVCLLALLLSAASARRVVRPVRRLTRVAQRMAAGDLTARNSGLPRDETGLLGDTLNRMADEIQKREKVKNDFIASVSHELRTPLTAIKGWTVTLQQIGPEDAALMGEGLRIIDTETDRLTGMVEELLDFSRIESDTIRLNFRQINVRTLLEDAAGIISFKAQRAGVRMEISADELWILVDADRMKQVLLNLLDNALRFTPAGGLVSMTAGREDREVVIHVRDTGSGISPEDLPFVKERFYKGKSRGQTGLGLAIADGLVARHGGRMQVDSVKGTGTTVTVSLPDGGDAV